MKAPTPGTAGAAGRVVAVSISEAKGTRKHAVAAIRLRAGYGVEGDAHAGTVRQVSLLCEESVEKMRRAGLEVGPGDFAENICIAGLALSDVPVGTSLRIGESAKIRITQIGKECHQECEIRRQTGTCIMPQEGLFAEVLSAGEIVPGDEIRVI